MDKVVGILKSDPDEGWDVKMFHSDVSQASVAKRSTNEPDVDKTAINKNLIDEEINDCYDVNSPLRPPKLSREDSNSFPSPSVTSLEALKELNRMHNLPSSSVNADDAIKEVGVRFIDPRKLSVNPSGPGVYDLEGPIEQFAIECSQSELLAMDKDIISKILSCPHINDVRTVFLAHDKRMLSVLTTPSVMRDYLPPHDVEILMTAIIDTYICGVHYDIVQIAKKNRYEWMIKPNGGGKGIGIVFGKDCENDESWCDILDNPKHANYVIQKVVSQQKVAIQRASGLQEMLVVGILHCFNNKFLGPGIFRASSLSQPIVNVSGGNGIILSPAVLSSRWKLTRKKHSDSTPNTTLHQIGTGENLMFEMPDECIFKLCDESLSLRNIRFHDPVVLDEIWETLSIEGIALVHCPWAALHASSIKAQTQIDASKSDCKSDSVSKEINTLMLDFVQQLGGIPHSHTNGGPEGNVWDVRPFFESIYHDLRIGNRSAPTDFAPPPRSHTADEFDMHTDCSFEDPPPRYVALYVMQEDQCGGGYSTLIDTDVINRYMSRRSLQTFLTTDFVVSVPPEFHKGVDCLSMKLITADQMLWKYRADIIKKDLCTNDQILALDELDSLLRNPSLVLTTMIPTGCLLLLDNMRWFHGRSAIKDQNRWLKRIRFQPSADRAPPALKRLVSRSDSLIVTAS